MQDDFDSGMGIPDDELAGESAMSEGDALGGHDGEVELEAPENEPVGRASGGARALSSGGAKTPSPRKAAPAPKKAVAKKTAKPASKAKPARKSARSAKKSVKKALRRSAPKKAAKSSGSKKSAKKGGARRKAGRKK